MKSKVATKTDGRLAARLAGISSLGAAVIHFAVLPTHWQDWTPAGLFFATIALFQLIWALVVWVRPTAAVLGIGIAANVGAAALWAQSRTEGVPFGPNAGEPEVVDAAGLCVLLLECYVVMGAGWAWYRGRRAEPLPGFVRAVVSSGVSAVIAAAATVGVATGTQHDHHAPAGAEHDLHAPLSGHADGHHDSPEMVAPRIDVAPPPFDPPPAQGSSPATNSAPDGAGDHHHDE